MSTKINHYIRYRTNILNHYVWQSTKRVQIYMAVSAKIGECRTQKESLSTHILEGTFPYKEVKAVGARLSGALWLIRQKGIL